MNIKRALISGAIAWTLGSTAYISSYFFHLMDDAEMQANIVLAIALIPSAIIGAWFYYKKGATTNGFKLGSIMFLLATFLDALITVPVFLIPNGGSHLTFFGDTGYWIIALEYILVVGIYSIFRTRINESKKQIKTY